MSLSRDRVDNISKALVGVSFDFEANQWMAKYGNTINIFPLPNKVASPTKRDNTNDTILSGVKVPNYPFEQAYIEASKWFLGQCAFHRARAVKEGNSQTGKNSASSPKKRRGSTSIDTRPQKKVAVEGADKNGDSVESPTPGEAKANFPVLSKEIGVKSVHSVSDYRVEEKEEQYLITARRAEAQDLEGEEEEDEDQEYEVECLLDVRMVGKREEFLVKWKDYPPAENTWEPLANLTGVEPSELEQCRQKQAYLIVPRSNRVTNKESENPSSEEASKVSAGGGETAAHPEESGGVGDAISSTVPKEGAAINVGEVEAQPSSENVEGGLNEGVAESAEHEDTLSAAVIGEAVNSHEEHEMPDAPVEAAHAEGDGEQIFLDVLTTATVADESVPK